MITMRIIKTNIEVDDSGWARIYFVGDSHAGSKCADKHGLETCLETVWRDKHAHLISMGDECDVIIPKDKRYDLETSDMELRFIHEQFGYIEKLLKPIADEKRLIGMIMGNHGSTFAIETIHNELIRMCDRFGTHYLGETAVVKVNLTKNNKIIKTYIIHVSHGYGGGYELGSAVNRISKEPRIILNAAVHACGHTHKLFVFPDVVGLEVNNVLKTHYAWFINTGSFLRAYVTDMDSYAQKKHYKPNPLGYAVLHLSKDDLKAETVIIDKNKIWG